MFVTIDDFKLPPYELANLKEMVNSFNQFITEQEADCLKALLGETFYAAFVQGLAVEPTPDQRWIDLRDGVKYIGPNGQIKYTWVGMKKIMRPYIVAMWTKASYDSNSGIGVVVPKAENGEVKNPSARIVERYNEFSDYVGDEYNWCDYNTLYGYLYYMHDLYNGDVTPDGYTDFRYYLSENFQCPGRMNVVGI
jgi:hypothetical protein